MKLPALVLCAALASCSSLQQPENLEPENARAYTDHLSFLAGVRSYEDSDLWDPVDTGLVAGLEYSRTRAKNDLGFEVGLLGSLGVDDSEFGDPNVIGVGAELYGGVRKNFSLGKFRPFLGAGGTFLFADVNNDSGGGVPDDQDSSLGYYLHGGVMYPVTDATFLGLDLRYVGGTDLNFSMIDGDADYTQLLFLIGVTL